MRLAPSRSYCYHAWQSKRKAIGVRTLATSTNGTVATPLSLALTSKNHADYVKAAKEAGLVNEKGTPNKPSLWDVALNTPDAATFENVAKIGGHNVASFSANGEWPWYYDLVKTYVDSHMGGEDDGSTYAVLASVLTYIGKPDEEVDAILSARREALGAGAKDRLAKAREKNLKDKKKQETIIQILMRQLDMTPEQMAALEEQAEAALA